MNVGKTKKNEERQCTCKWRTPGNEKGVEKTKQSDQDANQEGSKQKERVIAMNAKSNPKLFWKYVNSRTRTVSKVGNLYKDERKQSMAETDYDKANVLNEYFSNVFITEPDDKIPKPNNRDTPFILFLFYIRNVINKLNRNK